MVNLKGNEGISVGDIFCSSWGYEQTNISYYQVTRIVGKTMVELSLIRKKTVEQSSEMVSRVEPIADAFVEGAEKFKRKVTRYSETPRVSITSFSGARLISKDVNGNYPSAIQTSYY